MTELHGFVHRFVYVYKYTCKYMHAGIHMRSLSREVARTNRFGLRRTIPVCSLEEEDSYCFVSQVINPFPVILNPPTPEQQIPHI